MRVTAVAATTVTARVRWWVRRARAAPDERADSAEPVLSQLPAEASDAAEPTDPTDRTLPTEATDRTLPTEPTDRKESTDPIDRADPFDHRERQDVRGPFTADGALVTPDVTPEGRRGTLMPRSCQKAPRRFS
ncbi:hypothetical protein [Streptomyces galbus]|uniref:Secreted protein n=1 Tax=Streptomyces galbus TaxID=33898 RepID=A0ABX1IDA1_STRGB|nr:hypothetical protein [Streptomyces galbus]NKQ23175.1 hypothetical protein [Streptomyces galbus]